MNTGFARSMMVFLIAVWIARSVVPLVAHHTSVAQLAANKSVSVRGTLTKLEWAHPHGWIYLIVKNQKGLKEDWAVETGAPSAMMKRGLNKSDLMPGVELIVSGYLTKDGSRTIAGMVITFPDREAQGHEATFTLGR
jgi:hypothetical protein